MAPAQASPLAGVTGSETLDALGMGPSQALGAQDIQRKYQTANHKPHFNFESTVSSPGFPVSSILYSYAFDLRTTTPCPWYRCTTVENNVSKGCAPVCGILPMRQAIRAQAALSRHPTGITSISLSPPSVRSPFSPPFTPLGCAVAVEPAAGSTGPAAGQARQVSGFSDGYRFQWFL